MQLYGKEWNDRELRARVGRMEQVAGVRRYRLVEGPEEGVEQIEVRTGAGLRYLVSPHRGLDIGLVEFCGVPLSWLSPNGDVHPAYFQPGGMDWLRTAAGGMLMTCGMTQVGSPCEDDGESLGIHGRVHHTAASEVEARTNWIDDNHCKLVVGGVVRQTRMFGEVLTLQRRVESIIGNNDNSIVIRDTVRNEGFKRTPLMMLYHFNFGFPFLSEDTTFSFPSGKVTPRPPDATIEGYDRWQSPDAGYRERVYYHSDLSANHDERLKRKMAEVVVSNPSFRLPDGSARPTKVALRWSTDTLPNLVQWKMAGAGMHVMGIEPANCWVEGRKFERERGTLKFIEPGEELSFVLDFQIR